MVCLKCNRPINEGFNVCPYCGTPVYRPTAPNQGGGIPKHLFYRDRFKTQNILNLVAQILTLVMLICLLFLPIYSAQVPFDDLSWDDLEDIDEDDIIIDDDDMYVVKNFSAFDELSLFIDTLLPDKDKDDEEDEENIFSMMAIVDNLFILFEFAFAIVVLITFIPNIKNIIDDLTNPDAASLIKYNEIKKSGGIKVKENMFKKQMALSVVMYAVFDVVYTKLFSKLYGSFGVSSARMMNYVSGPSVWVIFPILAIVAFAIVKGVVGSIEKKVKVEIFMEAAQNGEEE